MKAGRIHVELRGNRLIAIHDWIQTDITNDIVQIFTDRVSGYERLPFGCGSLLYTEDPHPAEQS